MARVLLHTLVFSPDAVSTSYLMTDLARQLKIFGHDVVVLTTTPHYNLDVGSLERQPMRKHWLGLLGESSLDGIPVWHVRLPMKGDRVYTRVLDYLYFHLVSLIVGLFRIGRYDLVITPSPPLTIGIVGWLLSGARHVPFVYNIQEIYPDFAVNQGLIKNRLFIRILKWLERFVYDRSARVVSISEWFNQIVKDRVDNRKLVVIPNFVDTQLYRPLPRSNAFAEQHDLVRTFNVLYGGNIGLSQDWDAFLLAAERLHDLPIQFVIVGDGARRKWLEETVVQRNLRNIRLLGYQARETMALVNASADICTIPMKASTTKDTFPSKIYTIMACAKSVIVQADDDSELAWLINSVKCGRVVPPGDAEAYVRAVELSYHDNNKLTDEGQRGFEFVKRQYSKEVVGEKYSKLVHDLTRNGLTRT
ncbi:MAG: glycosyltransferase family 4 protein [Bacteroidota bacterium]